MNWRSTYCRSRRARGKSSLDRWAARPLRQMERIKPPSTRTMLPVTSNACFLTSALCADLREALGLALKEALDIGDIELAESRAGLAQGW